MQHTVIPHPFLCVYAVHSVTLQYVSPHLLFVGVGCPITATRTPDFVITSYCLHYYRYMYIIIQVFLIPTHPAVYTFCLQDVKIFLGVYMIVQYLEYEQKLVDNRKYNHKPVTTSPKQCTPAVLSLLQEPTLCVQFTRCVSLP